MSEYFVFGWKGNSGIPEIFLPKVVSIFGKLSLLTLSELGWGGIIDFL